MGFKTRRSALGLRIDLAMMVIAAMPLHTVDTSPIQQDGATTKKVTPPDAHPFARRVPVLATK